jgi:hypothetical protein
LGHLYVIFMILPLTHTVQEAEAHLASIQRFVGVLHAAVAVAAYMVADEEYQRKRYGILGQLVNQGRALARHQTLGIIIMGCGRVGKQLSQILCDGGIVWS